MPAGQEPGTLKEPGTAWGIVGEITAEKRVWWQCEDSPLKAGDVVGVE